MSKRTKGQSLVEFALSVPLLILVFSGIIDLGRAYFAWVHLESAISEGANWAVAYPACIASADSYTTGFWECRQSNAIDERILNEESQLNRGDFLCLKAEVIPSEHLANPQPGDEVRLQVKFQVLAVTPIVGALFGKYLYVYSEAREVIRGQATDLPTVSPIVMADQGGITPGCAIP